MKIQVFPLSDPKTPIFAVFPASFHGMRAKAADYLVTGIYATFSWVHSGFGRKIEKAVKYY